MGLWDNREKQFNKVFNSPENNMASKALLGAGIAAGSVGDVTAIPLEALLNVTGATPYLAKGVQSAMEHNIGKWLIQLAKDNPRTAEHMGAIANIVGIMPLAKIVQGVGVSGLKAAATSLEKGQGLPTAAFSGAGAGLTALPLVGTVTRNMNTLQRGGFLGDVKDLTTLAQSRMAPKTLTKNQKLNTRTLKQIVTGRNKTTSSGFNFYGPNRKTAFVGEALTGLFPALRQSFSPSALAIERVTGRTLGGRQEIKKLILDENLSGRAGSEAMQLQMHLQKTGNLPSGISKDSPIFNSVYVTAPFNIVDDVVMKSSLYKHVPDNIAKYQMNHIRNVAWNFDPDIKTNVLVKRPEANSIGMEFAGAKSNSHAMLRNFQNGKMLESYKKLHNTKDISDTGMIEITQIASALDKSNILQFKKSLKNIKIKSDQLTSMEIFNEVLNARRKRHLGIELNNKESIYLNNWEKLKKPYGTVKDSNNNIISNSDISKITIPDDGIIHTIGTFLSANKELGGVNFIASTDLKTRKIFVGGSDASDLFGMTEKGADQLLVAIPPSVINLKKQGKYKADFKASRSIDKKTLAKLNLDKRQQRLDLEKLNITPSFEDYNQVIKNIGKTGAVSGQTDTDSEIFKGLFSPIS